MGIQIGHIRLAEPVILAPMSGVTDLPFRRLVKRLGAGLVVSEMIASQAMIRQTRQSLKLAAGCAEEFPMAVQLAGCEPEAIQPIRVPEREPAATPIREPAEPKPAATAAPEPPPLPKAEAAPEPTAPYFH